ncbi:MAG: choice-of-anchor Q domain-containing protein [Lysobacterales bacterium]
MNARALPFAIAAALGLAVPVAGRAATLPVTSCADDGSAGTLRSVVASAHDGDTIDLTQLTCSTITLVGGPVDTGLLGPNPLSDLSIIGPGQDALVISGAGNAAVLFAGGPYPGQGTLTVQDLTIAHGAKYDAPACIFSTGNVVLDRVTVTDCHSVQANHARGGGAVGANGLYVTDSTISDSSVIAANQGIATGGGAWAGRMSVVRSTISGNRASAAAGYDYFRYQTSGGGLYAKMALSMVDSTIANNAVEATNPGQYGSGGGVRGGFGVIGGTTFSGNTADGSGGAMGGARYLPNQPQQDAPANLTTILNCTFTGNSARAGGAVFAAGNIVFANDTLAANTTTLGGALMFAHVGTANYHYTLYLDSTIIADNASGADPPHAADLAIDPRLMLTVIGANNLVGAADPAIVLPPDTLVGVDPQLLPLADNGGPTWTMALAPGSPAIDTGSNPDFLDTDQRGQGYLRVFGPAADIGAYEAQPAGEVIFVSGFD